jgi:hypothetical protein
MMPVFYLIILYEMDNHYRTLISQLVTTCMFCAFGHIISVQIPAIFNFIFGPFSITYCYFDLLIRGTFVLQIIALINFGLIVRYVLTFYFQNPTAAQHDFWALFLSVWSFAFGLITTAVFVILPGNNVDHFYVCVGWIPRDYSKQHKKRQLVMFYLVFLTFILHLVLGQKLRRFEKILNSIQPNSTIQKNMFVTLSSQIMANFVHFLTFLPIFYMSAKNIRSLLNYPDYLWMYYFHFYSIQNFFAFTVFSLLFKNPAMFQFVKREIKSRLM